MAFSVEVRQITNATGKTHNYSEKISISPLLPGPTDSDLDKGAFVLAKAFEHGTFSADF